MQVTKMLLSYDLEKLLKDCDVLYQELKSDSQDPEVGTLVTFMDRKVRQIRGLLLTLSFLEKEKEVELVDISDIYRVFHQIKLELRFCRRKWKRIQTVGYRQRKASENEAAIVPVAA